MHLQRWGSLNELVEMSGLSLRTLQYIRKQEPNVLVYREKGKRVEYDIPACNTNLRKRERDLAVKEAEPTDLKDAQTRKMAAEARLAEIEVALAEGRVVTVEETAKRVQDDYAAVRAQLLTLPQRWAPQLVVVKTILEAQTKLEQAVAETMSRISGAA